MKQFGFPVRIAIPQMRFLSDEYNGTKACNDADPCATVRQRVHRIYLAAPLGAQVRSEVHPGLYVDQPASVLGCLKLAISELTSGDGTWARFLHAISRTSVPPSLAWLVETYNS
jgi:hypothetical protein